MKLVALMLCRNESWIAGLSTRVALMWCDHLVVMNHASTDGTSAILEQVSAENPGRLTILPEPNPVWYEMAYRQRLLDAARGAGATHCAIVDSDEVLTHNLLVPIRGIIENLPAHHCLSIPMFAMWRSPYQYRSDPANVFSQVCTAIAFADHPSLSWYADKGYEFHHRHPYGADLETNLADRKSGGIMHLQFSDWNRITAKHALYKILEVTRWPGKRSIAEIEWQYSNTLKEKGLQTTIAPPEWWSGYAPLFKYLRLGEVPWQAAEARRLVAMHGQSKFRGLDLFGVA